MSIYIKDTILKILGYTLLFLGGLLFLLGLGMWIEGDPEYVDAGRGISIFSLGIFIPGIFMIINANRINREEKKIEYLVQLIKSYRRISLDLLATKTGDSPDSVEKLLAIALSKKLLNGWIDRTTVEFCTEDITSANEKIKICSSCGSAFDKVFIEGDTIKCSKCGNIY